ncbi:MAG: mevalonate kinase [Chloroflexota bacterium]
MIATTASAPGKIILFGEHAVVYGRPAIAAPVMQVRATATIEPLDADDVLLTAPDLGLEQWLSDASAEDALASPLRQLQAFAQLPELRGFQLTVTSAIPIASGLGSGAAISVAILRAAGAYLGLFGQLPPETVSALAFEVEKVHHGTPSGIDNTVVTYEQPVYFVRAEPQNRIEAFQPHSSLQVLIGDTGVRSSTRDVVGDVRRQWSAAPQPFERIFDACGRIAEAARPAIVNGDVNQVGRLMDENQRWLEEMTVSSPELEKLILAARDSGALGAKLSGGGRGGNMIALVTDETRDAVREGDERWGGSRVGKQTGTGTGTAVCSG